MCLFELSCILELHKCTSVAQSGRIERSLLPQRSALYEAICFSCCESEEIVLSRDVACVAREILLRVLRLDLF